MRPNLKEPKPEIKKLKAENTLKTEWISLLSHNLKENLGSLLWLIESLEAKAIDSEDFFKLLPRIKQDTKKNLKSIDDTEQWIKTRLQGFHPQPTSISINELYADLQQDFAIKLNEKQISFQLKTTDNAVIRTDEFLLRFILKKLLDNAIKFSPSGACVVLEAQSEGSHTVLKIKDSGIGMSNDQLKALFSFPGIISKGTDGEMGAGLSLKIVKNFADLINGKIDVLSDQQEGTTVLLQLVNSKR